MKNYSRKKSTPGKVAYRTPSRVKAARAIIDRELKATCCSRGLKGKCSC